MCVRMTPSISYLMIPLLPLNSASFPAPAPVQVAHRPVHSGLSPCSVWLLIFTCLWGTRDKLQNCSFQGFCVTGKDFNVLSHPTLFHIIFDLILLFLSIHWRADLIWALIISSVLSQMLSYTSLPCYLGYLALGTSKSKIFRLNWELLICCLPPLILHLTPFLSYGKILLVFNLRDFHYLLFNQYLQADGKMWSGSEDKLLHLFVPFSRGLILNFFQSYVLHTKNFIFFNVLNNFTAQHSACSQNATEWLMLEGTYGGDLVHPCSTRDDGSNLWQ